MEEKSKMENVLQQIHKWLSVVTCVFCLVMCCLNFSELCKGEYILGIKVSILNYSPGFLWGCVVNLLSGVMSGVLWKWFTQQYISKWKWFTQQYISKWKWFTQQNLVPPSTYIQPLLFNILRLILSCLPFITWQSYTQHTSRLHLYILISALTQLSLASLLSLLTIYQLHIAFHKSSDSYIYHP